MNEKTGDTHNYWQELKALVHAEYQARVAKRTANNVIYAKLVLLLTIIGGCYLGALTTEPSILWLSWWAAIGIASFFLIVNGAHDAAHGCLFRSKPMNRAFLSGSFGLFGIDGILWGLRHIAAHHPHTNVSAVDPDSTPNSYLRLSPHHPWKPWFRFQHLYAVLLYPFAFIHTAIIQDFDHLINKPLPYVERIKSRPIAFLRMLTVKLSYLLVFLILPHALVGIGYPYLLAGIAVQFGLSSLVFVLSIALNHYVTETTFYSDTDDAASHDNLIYQLQSSADWNPTSRICCEIMGGANAHTAHHLFPSMSHHHSPWISKIIQDFCERKGLTYNSFTFTEGISSHFRFLRQLGVKP